MSIPHAITAGMAGNEISKKITGSDEVSVGRTVVATGAGAAVGAVTAGTVAVVVGAAAAPVAIPFAVGAAAVGAIASLFD